MCVIFLCLLPVVEPEKAMLEDPKTGRQTTIAFNEKSELIVSGRVMIEQQTKMMCAALGISGKENAEG